MYITQDEKDVTFVPNFRTITRHGRLAGTWRRTFNMSKAPNDSNSTSETDDTDGDIVTESDGDTETESDNSEREDASVFVTVTKSGRKAGTWQSYKNM